CQPPSDGSITPMVLCPPVSGSEKRILRGGQYRSVICQFAQQSDRSPICQTALQRYQVPALSRHLDCPEENHNIPEEHQVEDLIDVKVEGIHGGQEAIAIWADQRDGSMRRNPPERCPRPLCPQDCPEENHNIPEDHQQIQHGLSADDYPNPGYHNIVK
ncbi:unnamed protein product, partial [Ranitomeya imitator]